MSLSRPSCRSTPPLLLQPFRNANSRPDSARRSIRGTQLPAGLPPCIPPTTLHLLSPPPKLTVTVASLPTPLLIYPPLCPQLSHHFPTHLQPHSSVSGGGLDSLPFQTRRRGSSLSPSFIPLSILHSFFSQLTSLASDEGVRSAAIDLRLGLTQLQCMCVSGASRRTPKRASTHAA